MSELANKKKSYLVEKRKFDKLKGDMDAMLSATRIFHTKALGFSELRLFYKILIYL